MIVVALFRNFNQGQAGTPRAAELINMFRSFGAADARSIRSNGTVAVRAHDPRAIVNGVRDEIAVTPHGRTWCSSEAPSGWISWRYA